MQGHSKIVGIGAYVPEQIVTSRELLEEVKSERLGIPVTWLEENVGIYERRVVPAESKPSDLAIPAAKVALADVNIAAADLDMIIFCGIEGDWMEPATAHLIQAVLESTAVCFDLSNACHGFMNGLSVADAMIGTGNVETVLVVIGEMATYSSMLHPINYPAAS
ncbi:MAG: hypothetical protein O7D86_03005 [Proteobacteria bacterium]|nr:hypothetical protein [Pseudomonadota bacterium]